MESLGETVKPWRSYQPEEIDFREELPLTRVGKVACTELEKKVAEELTAS